MATDPTPPTRSRERLEPAGTTAVGETCARAACVPRRGAHEPLSPLASSRFVPPLPSPLSLSIPERLIADEVRKARGPPPPTSPPLTSPLLARAAAFLPDLAAANEALAAAVAAGAPPSAFDVEAVDDGAPHVEMEVACGVVDLKDAAALAAAEAALAAGGGGVGVGEAATTSCDSDSESESGESDGEDEGGVNEEEGAAAAAAPAGTGASAPPRRRKRRAGIEEVG